MCLLIVLSRVHPDGPLVVAANRDELLAREAVPMTTLSATPRVLGGRDALLGGTWLATSRAGVVAALTNRPSPMGRDPSLRSRGELPLLAASFPTAAAAAASLARTLDPRRYNPCWLLVGDRRSLFYLEVGEGPLTVEELPPGLWVLENQPLHAPSPKADFVRDALAGVAERRGPALLGALHDVLRSHALPPGTPAEGSEAARARPPATLACCVHADVYGTRSSTLVVVPEAQAAPPTLRYTSGPPCTHPFLDGSAGFDAPA